MAYEGGPGISNTGDAGQVGLAALRDPRMEKIVYQSYIDWFANGGDQANFYGGPYGIWGPQCPWPAAELGQANNPSASPKYAGLMDVINTPAALPQLADAGFESIQVGTGAWGSFQYGPTGSPWTFSGAAGVSGNGSGFTVGNLNAPEGPPGRLPPGNGSLSQHDQPAGRRHLQISFAAAQRGNYQASRQDFQVLVDGQDVGTYTPTGTSYARYTTTAFTVAAVAHTIEFRGLDSAGGDNTAFLDDVHILLA